MKSILEKLLLREDLTEAEADRLLVRLTEGTTEPALSGAVLAALRSKGETAEELRGFAGAMRRLARRPVVEPGTAIVDLVGTGGDGSGSLNLSTGAALVAAACGLPVVKHGNRAVSSRSGSADVLEALGYELPEDPDSAGACLERAGFTFLFAPYFHPAMKAVAPVRRALGIRTLFNLLGPLTNPAEPPFHVIGAYSPDAARKIARTLSGMNIDRAFVVHGEPGWDEPTPAGPFLLLDVRPGKIEERVEDPLDYGVKRCVPSDLAGGDAEHNARCLRRVMDGERNAHRDALVLGAALALRLTGAEDRPRVAAGRADAAITDGSAALLLEKLVGSTGASSQTTGRAGA